MTKPPSNWHGRCSRDDLHLDAPMTLREQAVACAVAIVVLSILLTFAVIGALSR